MSTTRKTTIKLKSIKSELKTKKRNLTIGIAIAAVAAPIYFFIPGAEKVVKSTTRYIEKGLKILKHKDMALETVKELQITDDIFMQVNSYVKKYITELNNIIVKNTKYTFKRLTFTGPDINWSVNSDELDPNFTDLMAKTHFITYSMENIIASDLDNFARALILLSQYLTPTDKITNITPIDDNTQLASYITLVNMLQMALVKETNPAYDTVQQSIHNMLFNFPESESITRGGGISFMVNPMQKLKSIYKLDDKTIDNSIFSMYYSRDSLSKGIISDYMKYIIFSSIHDDSQRQQFELFEEQFISYMDKHDKYEDMLITDKPIHKYTVELVFKTGDPIIVNGYGNIEQIFVLMINKLMALLHARIGRPIDIDIIEIHGDTFNSNTHSTNLKIKSGNQKHFKVRQDTRSIKKFIELSNSIPKYKFILDLYISKNAPYFNMLYNRLLNLYCPIDLNNAIPDSVLFNSRRETNVTEL